MPTVAVYRCPKCRTEYRPLEAGARRFFCCNLPLERVAASRRNYAPPLERKDRAAYLSVSEATNPAHRPAELIEVVPPRENMVDALAVQTLITALSIGSLFSLEIAGDDAARRFLVRGTAAGVAHVRRQLQATYDQVSFRTLTDDEDPSRPSGLATACAQLTLARAAYLPVRTFEDGDFQQADPVKGILGSFDGMESGERALSQIILRPAPPMWSRRYEGSARYVEKNLMGEAMSFSLFVRQFVSVIGVMTAVAFGLWALLSFMQGAWLAFFFASTLFSFTVMGVLWLYTRMTEQSHVDPKLIQEKIATPSYDASIRLFVAAKTQERAESKVRELAAAYRCLDLQSGNALVARRAEFDPRVLALDRPSWWKELTAQVTRLSTRELAALWHLPVGAPFPGVKRAMARRMLPAAAVADGILVGRSVHHGQDLPAYLPLERLWHHVFMVAKTQKGKSTLMAHLAAAVMDLDAALVVIDPHGDLVRSLLGLVPKARVGDVRYVDFGDAQQCVGLNPLDMTQGRSKDAVVSNFLHVGELIWSDFWGPRMEDALRMALRTLLAANEILIRRQEAQFTLNDIPALYELPNFRHRLLKQYVSDSYDLNWWNGYYDRLYDRLRVDVINPVLTKIHRFSTHSHVRRIVGQSESTIHFGQMLDRRNILLVNTANGIIGPDAAGLLGAVLLDFVNFAVRQQMAILNPAARARVVVVLDEFQSIPGVDYPGLLAELQKMGASFILATQALGQLDQISPTLRETILANVEALFVFQTSAEDGDKLRHELDDEVTATDIINLSDYTCYLKTQIGRDRQPTVHVETCGPPARDPDVTEQILGQITRYTRSAQIVDAASLGFQEQWYGRELKMTRQLILLQGETNQPPDARTSQPALSSREAADSKADPDRSNLASTPSSESDEATTGANATRHPAEPDRRPAPRNDSSAPPRTPGTESEDPAVSRRATDETAAKAIANTESAPAPLESDGDFKPGTGVRDRGRVSSKKTKAREDENSEEPQKKSPPRRLNP